MYLNLYLLADALVQFRPSIHSNDAAKLYLRQVCPLQAWKEPPQPDTVYIGAAMDYKAYSFQDQLTAYICVDHFEEAPQNLQYIFFSEPVAVQSVLSCVDMCFARYDQANSRFLNALIRNAPLHEIMVCIADFFQNPIFCFDTSMTVLDIVDHYGQAEIDRKKWRSTVEYGHISTQTLGFIAEHHHSEAYEAYFEDYTQEHLRMIVAQLWWKHEKLLGALIIGDDFKRMNSGHLALANYVAVYVTDIVHCQNQTAVDYSALDMVFHNLLGGFKCEMSYLQSILSPLDWKPEDYYCVCVIPLTTEEKQGELYGYGMREIKSLFESNQLRCFYSAQSDEQIFIINLKQQREIPSALQQGLEQLLPERNTCIGISPAIPSITDIDSLYVLAKEAIRIGKTVNLRRTVFLYDKLRLIHVLDTQDRPKNPFTVCDGRVLALAKLDEDGESDYIRTLYIYLLHERSLKSAAAALFIHRNSLVYRLGKINDILQYDLDDPFVREDVLLSCKLIMLHDGNAEHLACLVQKTP